MTPEIRSLLHDVADATGVQVSLDDPLVAAALTQSRLVRAAGDAAAQAITGAAVGTSEKLADAVLTAVGTLEEAAGDISRQLTADLSEREAMLAKARVETKHILERELADARVALSVAANAVLREAARGAAIEQLWPGAWVGLGFLAGAATAFFAQSYLVRNQLNFIIELIQGLTA